MNLKNLIEIWKAQNWSFCHLPFYLLNIGPFECPLLHTVGNRSHDAIEISNKTPVECRKPMETSSFRYGCWSRPINNSIYLAGSASTPRAVMK